MEMSNVAKQAPTTKAKHINQIKHYKLTRKQPTSSKTKQQSKPMNTNTAKQSITQHKKSNHKLTTNSKVQVKRPENIKQINYNT